MFKSTAVDFGIGLGLTLSSIIKCVTLGKICNFFEPQVCQMWSKTTINITYLTGLIKDLSRVHDIKEVHINGGYYIFLLLLL